MCRRGRERGREADKFYLVSRSINVYIYISYHCKKITKRNHKMILRAPAVPLVCTVSINVNGDVFVFQS